MQEKIHNTVALLKQAVTEHGEGLVYPCSMGAEGSVMIDLIHRHALGIQILTLDTGRLPQATYDVIEAFETHYGITILLVEPDSHEIADMIAEHGVNLFRQSVELRKHCCEIRKVHPLMQVLAGKSAWMTGRRREQSKGRADLQAVESDPVYQLTKYNPMLDWRWDEVMQYIRANNVPYNKLHDAHYLSIGCECCTRAITVGEDERAGRWWWEHDDAGTECGLHVMSIKQLSGEIEGGEGI